MNISHEQLHQYMREHLTQPTPQTRQQLASELETIADQHTAQIQPTQPECMVHYHYRTAEILYQLKEQVENRKWE